MITFIRYADDSIEQVEEINDQLDDIAIINVDDDVVQHIEDSSCENPKNYPELEITADDIAALIIMLDEMALNHNDIQVLETYTSLIRSGMRPEYACPAAVASHAS